MTPEQMRVWEKSVDRHVPTILDVLKQAKQKLSTNEIADRMGLSRCLTSTVLNRMRLNSVHKLSLAVEREPRKEPGRPRVLFYYVER